jgi:hypothetical protein
LTEVLRIASGTAAVGWDTLVRALLVSFIIFLPQGRLGSLLAPLGPSPTRARHQAPRAAPSPSSSQRCRTPR